MTGGELIVGKAIASATSRLAETVTSDKGTVKATLVEIARDTPQMKAAADAYASRIAIKESFLLRLYSPLAKVLRIGQDYLTDEFALDMAAKTANIPEESMILPPANIAIPAMEGLVVSLDLPDLKEMYLNLLATATDSRRDEEAHPSYAEIIKQLSPREAQILVEALKRDAFAIVRLKADHIDTSKGFNLLMEHLLDWHDNDSGNPVEEPLGSMFVENWVRLGLVTVDFSTFLIGDGVYDWVERRPEYIRFDADLRLHGLRTISYDRGGFRRTNFGLNFASAVSPVSPVPTSTHSESDAEEST